MRYLYGDSVPFPPQYDFLAALEAFCTHAARIVRLDAECTALRRAAEAAAAQRAHAADELEAFHKEAIGAVEEAAKESTQPLVHDYARQVAELATSIADAARRSAIVASDRDAQTTRAECDRRRAESRDALEKLMAAVRLPVSETHVTMSLVDGRNDFAGTFVHEGDLLASFTLAGGEIDEWRAPRHVRELSAGMALPVGVKRSLFKRTVAAETIPLDEYVISGFELRDESAEIRLRKRLQDPDSIVFTLRRASERLVAEVHHPDDAEAESGLPAVMDASAATEVEKLWQLLRQACAPVLAKKKKLVKLTLGGDDVLAEDLGSNVVGLIVGVIAPVVAEVARRSPNQHELSLKMENDTGRREEIYLRKAQLVSALASVTPRARKVFDPLGIIASDPRESIESLTDEAVLTE